jgi:acetyl-CoA synthetase
MATDNATAYRQARDLLLRLRTDADAAAEAFTWPRLEGRFNWARDWFDPIARGNDGIGLWIVDEDGSEVRYSFDQLARRSDQVATWLADHGMGKGDPVVVMLGNQVELWETMLAIAKLGAVIMPTTTALGSADLADRVERTGASHVIASPADLAKFDTVPADLVRIAVGDGDAPEALSYAAAAGVEPRSIEAETEVGDPLLYYFTSGTTSRPKLVEHTQVSYPVGHLSTMYWLGVQPGDVHCNISSPGWAKHAWSCFFAPWIAEATIFVSNYTRFDAPVLLDQLRRAEVTTFCAPPTVWRMLIQADMGQRPPALREVLAAGEPLNPEVITQVERRWGLTIRDGFGQTETTAQVGNPPGGRIKPGSMGRPLPGVPVVLVDPASGEVSDTEGEICIELAAGPVSVMTGYLGDAERTAEVMAGGFYHTGDVASRDAEGYITFVGRVDDVFKASDYKISPFELESVLIEHPAVAEAAVVPAPDPIRLAVPKAFVALAAGWEPDRETAFSILKHARERLAPFQRVRRLEFFELPKTVSGKIRRVELRQREEELSGRSGEEFRDDDFPELKSAGA